MQKLRFCNLKRLGGPIPHGGIFSRGRVMQNRDCMSRQKRRQQFSSNFISTNENPTDENSRKPPKGRKASEWNHKKQRYNRHAGESQMSAGSKAAKTIMTNVIQNPEAVGTNAVPEGYISKEEVARRLTKTVRTIENWQRRGYLPFVKIGQSVLFRWSDVVAHLDQNFTVGRRPAGK